ncbi:hypothetical protein GPECTOR_67g306 [Gonium pectorale]|uniref:Uncharacterized protein n=1 Tax=Gonium pectorale TaxID=33097 RepID=A0A150G3L6_GONPE|nr:hypothetical protein GPECTOR_67g306 [Gonium pectorale]|eukprot:KXZ44466.1 hypothetical protein GPECTOR_67g306 [Gonium pectorale]
MADTEQTAQAEKAPFLACSSFEGPRDGYVFKLDDAGLGYYLDVPLADRIKAATEAVKEAAKAKPVVVKANNSLLKSLQKRGSAAALPLPSGVPKKAKTDDNKDASKPAYLREMERYKQLSCASDGKDSNRPLVK